MSLKISLKNAALVHLLNENKKLARRERMEEELEKIKEIIKKLNEEKELGSLSKEKYNKKVCEYFCNAAESSSLSSLLFLSSLLPSQLFLKYRSTKTGKIGYNAILCASKGASIEVMEFLLSFGFNINSLNGGEENCLFIAIKNGKSKEYIEYLFSKAANFLQISRIHGKEDNLCEILLRDGKYNDDKDVLEILKYLVEERGVDIHYKPKYDNSAILSAASHNVEIMKYLVSLHSDITFQNYRREGVIHFAIKANNMEVIEYLISLNVKLDYITDEGYTLFHYAIEYSNLKVIQYLVSLNQFDIHFPQNGGWNAIIIGAFYNSLEVIQYLVSLGINIQCTDTSGKNAFYICAVEYAGTNQPIENRFINMKYLVSLGIDTYQNNNMIFQQDIISKMIRRGNKEEIEFIHSLYHSYEFDKYKNLVSFSASRYFYDINILKYLIENNIIGETYTGDYNQTCSKDDRQSAILHIIIHWLSQPKQYSPFLKLPKEIFKRIKDYLDYFLERGNDINSIQAHSFEEIPFQLLLFGWMDKYLLWMIANYLIDKGSDLFHNSKKGSVLHTLFHSINETKFSLRSQRGIKDNINGDEIEEEETMKYIIIRSYEINEKSSAQGSMIQYIQHSKIQNNNKDSLLIYNDKNNNNEKEMQEEWKRVFFSFVLSSPLILSIENNKKKKFIINDNGELKLI